MKFILKSSVKEIVFFLNKFVKFNLKKSERSMLRKQHSELLLYVRRKLNFRREHHCDICGEWATTEEEENFDQVGR